MGETLKVSIIIPTFNCLNKLSRALRSIEEMDFPAGDYEVIVVDDGSLDGTGEYVKGLISKTRNTLHYVYQENRGPAAARNNGIKLAKGQYLLFVDADCFVDKNILNHYLKHFPDETLGGVGGNVLPDDINLITEFLDHVGVWRPGNGPDGISYLVTANAFFAKEAVVKAGYFDEDFRQCEEKVIRFYHRVLIKMGLRESSSKLAAEEPELCYRMRKKGYRFEYDKDAVVFHSHRTTFRGMIRMYYVHGKGYGLFLSKWPELPRWKPSFLRIITGVDSFRNFRFDYVKNVDPGKAVIFFVLDYLHFFASYYGYRAVMKGPGA